MRLSFQEAVALARTTGQLSGNLRAQVNVTDAPKHSGLIVSVGITDAR